MKKSNQIQEVKMVYLFPDENVTGEQFVAIDPQDGFMSLIHDGNEINLTLENWLSLREMADKVVERYNQNKG